MNRRGLCWVLAGAVAGTAAVAVEPGDGLRVTPPSSKAGVTCSVRSVTASTQLLTTPQRPPVEHTVNVQVVVKAETPHFIAGEPELTEVLDEREQDVTLARTLPAPTDEQRRQARTQGFRGRIQDDGTSRSATCYAYLKRFPPEILRMTGRVPVTVAKRRVHEAVKLEAAAEAVEIVPGLTFLLSDVQREDGVVSIEYEVRVRRGLEGVQPGLEPVFVGLVLRGRDGRIGHHFGYDQEVATRDEYIMLNKGARASEREFEDATLEVIVFDGLQEFHLEFGVEHLPLAARGDR